MAKLLVTIRNEAGDGPYRVDLQPGDIFEATDDLGVAVTVQNTCRPSLIVRLVDLARRYRTVTIEYREIDTGSSTATPETP